ncbi:MAG: isochorismatase family protein [Synergistales bacterium]|nr:isochorismatase family protein [Synergistales bacterium]
MQPSVLRANSSILLMIDMQAKLLNALPAREELIEETEVLLKCCSTLGVPVLATEHYPKGLGAIDADLAKIQGVTEHTFEKIHFSCCDEPGFLEELADFERNQVIVCGIETHICVYNTVMQLLQEGYTVAVVAEAIRSRNWEYAEYAADGMLSAGAAVLPLESVVYQLLGKAGTPEFKEVLAMIKERA